MTHHFKSLLENKGEEKILKTVNRGKDKLSLKRAGARLTADFLSATMKVIDNKTTYSSW
jgi:prolyl-tRNA editing enzyme YbaK/EbsC (Cys-tRNA(Pro) deacylase)